MKLNWGTSIVIAFALFMAFILYFVIRVQGNSKFDNELVVEEYYKHDAHFGEEMSKLQNAAELQQKPSISQDANGVMVAFPEDMQPEKISGKVSFYRPSAKKLDFAKSLALSGRSMLIPHSDFAGGLWGTTLEWSYNGQNYIIKKEIYIN